MTSTPGILSVNYRLRTVSSAVGSAAITFTGDGRRYNVTARAGNASIHFTANAVSRKFATGAGSAQIAIAGSAVGVAQTLRSAVGHAAFVVLRADATGAYVGVSSAVGSATISLTGSAGGVGIQTSAAAGSATISLTGSGPSTAISAITYRTSMLMGTSPVFVLTASNVNSMAAPGVFNSG